MAASTLYESLGRNLASARKAAGLTQEQLARRVDLSRATIANIEGGRQRVFVDQFFELASAVDCNDPVQLLPRMPRTSDEREQTIEIFGIKNLSREQERALAEVVRSALKQT